MSENIIIKESGTPKAMAIDELQLKKIDGGSEKWVPEAGEVNSLIKMDIGKNAEIEATDYNAYAITEVNVTREIADIEIQPDTTREGSDQYIVSIKEGDKSRFISGVKKLRVNLQSGGTTDLAPKESVVTGELYATELGTYVAQEDGYTGYSRVTVNLSDDDWGDLPDEIRVTTPPTKTEYTEGEIINYDGIVVKAYKNGEVWENDKYHNGTIPFNELILNGEILKTSDLMGNIAIKDAKEINIEADDIEWEYGKYNGQIQRYEIINGNEHGTARIYDRYNSESRFCILWAETWRGTSGISPYMNSITGILAAKYSNADVSTLDFIIGNGESPKYSGLGRVFSWYGSFFSGGAEPVGSSEYWHGNGLNLGSNNYTDFPRAAKEKYSYVHNNKTAYYQYHQKSIISGFDGGKRDESGAVPLPYPEMTYEADVPTIGYYPASGNIYNTAELGALAWTMLYGNTNVLVQWERPRDKRILSAFFEITFVES